MIIIRKNNGTVQVDSQLSTTSTNPVQNKVITEALNNIQDPDIIPTENINNLFN